MSSPFVGEMRYFGFNFPPKNWAMCNGQIMSISQNEALFSLLGTTYGGNGVQTFALPDLRGRVAVGMGQGLGLSQYSQGQQGGQENHTLLTTEMPAHNHTVACSSSMVPSGGPTSPQNNFWTRENNGDAPYQKGTTGLVSMAPSAVQSTSGSQPHENRQPLLVVTCCISLFGIYPSRN